MFKKSLLSLTLVLVMLSISAIPTFAAESQPATKESASYSSFISPRMKYTARASTNLSIDSKGKASITASIDGYQNVTTKVSISAELQQYKNSKWSSVTNFSDSKSSHRLRLSKTHSVTKGYSYRVVTTVTATHNGSTETQTLTSSEKQY